jgi:sugar/nucleoside kinase (ribokinase family)
VKGKNLAQKRDNMLKAAESLISNKQKLRSKKVVVGFDGFIDEIIHPVATKHDKDNFTRINTIAEFGKRILSASGKSSNIELVPILKKLGGNGPIMSLATAGLGPRVTCIGLLGHPTLEEEFKPLAERCQVVSIGEPGHTDALEFTDGKLMLGKLQAIFQMCWANIKEIMGEEAFSRLLVSSDLVACTNWTMLTEMEEILENIIRIISEKDNVAFFFDLADPEKRNPDEVERLFQQIKLLNDKSRCVLGLNLREAEQVSRVLGMREKPEDGLDGLKKTAVQIREKLGISGVTVHSVSYAGASVGDDLESVEGPFCSNPKIATGAGDHFNGGLCSGMLAGLSLEEALYVGVGTSGWYVRNNGESPDLENVADLLKTWAEGKLAD